MCVCVLSSFFILDVRLHVSVLLVGAPAGVTEEEGHAGGFLIFNFEILKFLIFFLHLRFAAVVLICIALVFFARKIRPSLSLVDREVECCVSTAESFSTCWA